MRTVFILGAGASMPYGLPSGYGLVEKILEVLRVQKHNFMHWGFSEKQVEVFEKAIVNSKPESIDYLLVQRKKEFLEIGKLAIASALVQFELKEELSRRDLDDDWYRYFFEHVRKLQRPLNYEEYVFITFNYDRSLEQYLDMAIDAHYGDTEPERKKAIADIPILHIHGHLGLLPSRSGNSPYAPSQDRGYIHGISRSLKLTNEETDGEMLASAQYLLYKAQTILFLGFGFDKNNLEKLDFENNCVNAGLISGTTYGKTEKEMNQHRKDHKSLNRLSSNDMKIVEFFRNVYPLPSD